MNLPFFHHQLQNRWFHGVILALGLAFFLPIYILVFVSNNVQPTALGYLEQGWILWALVANLAFSNLVTFIILSTLQLSLILVVLAWGKPHLAIKIGLVTVAIAIIALPVIYRYQPAVAVEAGYQGQVPTLPYGLNNVVRRAQVVTELQPCHYNLLGWSDDATLYYQENCADNPQTWAYQPVTQRLQLVDVVPTHWVTQSQSYGNVKGLQMTTHPADLFTWQAVLSGPIYISPDAKWQSVVVHHLYGPADVVVWAIASK